MRANTEDPVERTFTENARRTQIVRAAIETISELGYAKASFGQIAKRAGLSSTGMISYHFDGKADLIAEVLKLVFDESVGYMQESMKAVDGHAAGLRAYIESNVAYIAGHRAEIAVILDIVGNADLAGAGDWYGNAVAVLAQSLRDGQRDGDFGEFDARIMAITIRQAIDGLPAELALHPETDTAAYAAELVRTFARATMPHH